MNDRLMRVAIILSVFALIGMAGAGTAAAQGTFNVTLDDAPVVAPFDDTVDVTVNVTNVGASSGDANVTFAADDTFGEVDNGPPADVTGPSFITGTLAPGEFETRTLTLNTNTTYDPLTDATTSNDIVHGAFVNVSGTNTVDDTAEANFTVGTDSNGRVTVITQDTASSPNRVSTDVELYSSDTFNSVNDPGPLVRSGMTDSNGEIQFSGLAVGENDTLSEDYTAVAAVDDPEFISDTSQARLFDPDQTSSSARIAVTRVALPENFKIEQSAESALGDGEDEIEFNVSIIGNLDGSELENEPFTVFHDGGDAVNIANGSSFDTTSDGSRLIQVSSNISQRVTFEFVADNLDEEGNEVVELRPKSFVLQGEGTVIGDVFDTDDPNLRSLEDARVWAFQKDVFTAQDIRIPPNESSPGFTNDTAFVNEGQNSFFRLVKSEDDSLSTPSNDTVLDVTQDYRIDNDGQNENLSISRVRELNTSDSSIGSGWAVEANVDDPKSINATGSFIGTGMYVTPLDSSPEAFYYVQKSDNVLNASDQRFVDETAPNDPFPELGTGDVYEISGTSQFADNRGLTPNQPTQETVRRTGNLTFEAAQAFSSFSGQTLFDTTDENGEYVLDDMFTDFQAGVDYTIIANKGGYEIEFVDAFVAENGALFENGEDENFGMRRIEEDREVNVTNLALLDSIEDAPAAENADDPSAYEDDEFANQTDRFSQVVPRDGASIDVLQVNTQTESGAPVNDTIELSVPQPGLQGTVTNDVNFTGEFIAVAGGTEVDRDDDAPTITINTGPDGQAIVWLQSDLDDESLDSVRTDNINADQVCELGVEETELFSGVVAQSPTDAGVVDATCKDFRGTVVLQTAELSGIVTNQNNQPVESRVWTRNINLEGPIPVTNPTPGFDFTNQRIEVTRTGDDSYTVEHLVDNRTESFTPPPGFPAGQFQNERTLGIETGVTFNELSQDGGTDGYQGFASNNFPQIAVAGSGTIGFSLATDSDNVGDPATEDSSYTLPNVPAEFAATAGTPTEVKGIDRANFSFTGQSVATPVQIDRTSTANIEIKLPSQLAGQIDVADIDAPATVTQGDTLDVDATIENIGAATVTTDVDYELVNESGTVVETQTQSVTLDGGDNETRTFSVDTTGLAAENYTSTVTTNEDQTGESADTEVVANGGSGTLDPNNPFGDQNNNPVSVGDAADVLFQWNQNNGVIDGEQVSEQDLANFLFQWNMARS